MAPASASLGVWKWLLVVAGMFGFGFSLIPMYNALCQLTNLNGKDTGMLVAANVGERVDATRLVNVQFLTTVNGGYAWTFRAEQPTLKVHPGQLYTVEFVARNERDEAVVGQAVPSVTPWSAAKHLRKTECFCFNRQPFSANEEKRLAVRFMLDPELPADVDTVTLSYTFFDVTALAARASPARSVPPS